VLVLYNLCIAFVSDSPIGDLAERVANHFVSAQIKSFEYGELEAARSWIINGSNE
jgi:hypothetical protein